MKLIMLSMIATLLLGLAPSGKLYAQINADYAVVPPESTKEDPPVVMLSLSRDHQYFFKAYNDYTDLDPEDITDVDADGNPNVETTYKHSFDYFGYFDAYKCYEHQGGVFVPTSVTPDAAPDAKYCSGEWSGNFLNWATMTRMDIVRKIFYGGSRSTDTSTETVLERAFLPSDAHSFAKYYNGSDIGQLTPFGGFAKNGDPGDSDINLDNIDEGITICNTTAETGGASQDSTEPPLMRIAEGNYQLWGANERWQCTWSNERENQNNSNVPPSDPFGPTDTFPGLNSGIDANNRDPVEADGVELVVRVSACVAGLEGKERCKTYPDGNLKPTGLLQTYADDGLISFGLMTGSYENNLEGGVLRKNISSLRDEVDVLTDGRFIYTDTSDSIIKFLDILRPWGYDYSVGDYRGGNGNNGIDDCDFQLTDIPDGRCNSWGNPISEIFKETIRYMAGKTPEDDFAADDTNFINGMTDSNWVDPLTEENQCSDLNTILINASVSSYDDDNNDLDDVDGGINGNFDEPAAGTTREWTNRIGDEEIIINPVTGTSGTINGNSFVIGSTTTDTNERCTAKVVSSLADAVGLCPEAPTVNGSFGMAGIAYYAHNNDIRDDLDGNQTVNTFAISLATNVPIIRVPRTDGGVPLEILPAYRLLHPTRGEGGGALVDFKIVKPHTRIGTTNTFEASYYINWEDSEQGGDYDQDMWGTIDYLLDQTTNQIEITTTTFAESTNNGQLFGFVTNGTDSDGFHAYSGIAGADSPDTVGGVPGCNNCRAISENSGQQGPQSHTFDIAASTVSTLESPLYYAAKYGGFEELLELVDDPDSADPADLIPELPTVADQPDEVLEWDSTNNITGENGSDGLPDNFFFVINPENLFNSLEIALNKILSEDTAANSAVASFANSNGFENIIVQGTYQELTRGESDTSVSWTGEIFSYFIDEFGLFREDNQQAGQGIRGKLENPDTTNDDNEVIGYTVDRAFRYTTVAEENGANLETADAADKIPMIQYLSVASDPLDATRLLLVNGLPVTSDDGDLQPVDSINTLWNGGERLRNLNNNGIINQRAYATRVPDDPTVNAASRFIFTYIDTDLDGRVDDGEQTPFLASEVNNTNFGFFGMGSTADAAAVVDYTRGFDDTAATGFRSRTLQVDNEPVVYRLGDLVNSTPLIVAGASENYDTQFGDESYGEFRELYEGRRQMAYVGTNDGLLHAFNVGFRDTDSSVVQYTEDQGTKTQHPLGSELWAYAPSNLLPHLQWLTSNFYSHVFYVDGNPKAYDVKIFQPSTKHPGGWGTILVVGMRLGGGDFPVTTPVGNSVSKSAYIIMDITDPEDEPEILAEVTDPDLNFTTSEPALFYDCEALCDDGSETNNFNGKWQLIFGSGPNNLKTFSTTESAKIFAYDLETQAIEQHDVQSSALNGPVENSFVGAVSVKDWDNGLLGYRNDDVAYFGTVGTRAQTTVPATTEPIETGGVYRYIPNSPGVADDTVNRLIDVDRPVAQAPLLLSRESLGNDVLGSWVFFGTGIYLERSDEEINEQERYYGIFEPINTNALDNLSSVSNDTSFEDSSLLTYDSVTINDLVDVTNADVLPDDPTTPNVDETGDLASPIAGTNTFYELAEHIVTTSQGWFRELETGVLSIDDPSSRVTDKTVALRDQIFFTTFTPAALDRVDICIGGDGFSRLFAINQTTGTASPFATLGVDDNGAINDSVVIGSGTASSPVIFSSESLGSNSALPISQRGDGSLKTTDNDGEKTAIDDLPLIRSGWREIL